jgi:hypothetical protein
MLNAITQLTQNGLRNIQRILGNEINADALGANQTYHLFDFLEKRLRSSFEQQVRLIIPRPSPEKRAAMICQQGSMEAITNGPATRWLPQVAASGPGSVRP